MKRRIFIILGILLIFIFVGGGCPNDTSTKPSAALNVKLVQMITPTTFVIIEGEVPLDINNINWSWIKTKEGNNKLNENSHFVTRFELDYPLGLPSYDDVTLVVAASSQKIPELGIVTSGYQYLEQVKGKIREEEVNIHKYNFGQLKEGTHQSIIFAGTTGKIGTSLEDTVPLYVFLEKDGEDILNNYVEITIYR